MRVGPLDVYVHAAAVSGVKTTRYGAPSERRAATIGAALSSFFAFATGAIIPLAPFLFLAPSISLYVAIALSAASLFGVGAVLSLFTGKGAFWGGLRMVLLGAAAGGATFGIGRLLGVSLS